MRSGGLTAKESCCQRDAKEVLSSAFRSMALRASWMPSPQEGSMAAERSAIRCMPVDSRANGPIRDLVCRRDACWCSDGKFPRAHRRRNALAASEGSGKRDHRAEIHALAPSAETAPRGCSANLVIVSVEEDRKTRTRSDSRLHGNALLSARCTPCLSAIGQSCATRWCTQ